MLLKIVREISNKNFIEFYWKIFIAVDGINHPITIFYNVVENKEYLQSKEIQKIKRMLRNIIKKKNLEKIKIFSKVIGIENKSGIEIDVEEGNVKQYNNISKQYYFYYMILQEQSRKSQIQDQQFINVKEQAQTILLNQFNQDQDFLALRFIVEFDLYHTLNLNKLTNDLSENKIIVNYSNILSLSLMLQKLVQRSENEELQLIIYNKLVNFVKNELEKRVYSIPNEEFNDLLQTILIISEADKDFIQEIPTIIGFNFIQQKLQDYEQLEDLIQPEYMPSILYTIEKISQATFYKFKINHLKYDVLFKNIYKSLDSIQIYQLSCFFLMHLKEEPVNISKFFELFYFSQLSKTPYYNKEYMIRKLGIYNFDQPLLKLIRTAITRIFLLNVTQKEPKYRKSINLFPLQKLELVNKMLQSEQFKNSPLIDSILSETINSISEIYMNNVKLDYSQEYSQLHPLYKSIIQLLSQLTKELLQENRDCIYLLRIALNYYSLHSNKFDSDMIFNTIKIANMIIVKDPQPETTVVANENKTKEDNKQTQISVLYKENQYKLFLDIFKSKLQTILQGDFSDIQLVNNQQIIIPTLQLISKLFNNQFSICMSYLKQISSNFDKLNYQNKLKFIDFLNQNSINQPNEIMEILKQIINQFGETKILSDSYELKSEFLKLFMKFLNLLGDKDKYTRLLEAKITDLMSFQISNINENTILTTVQLIKQSQDSQINIKEMDILQDVFFRIISDTHSTYSLDKYQQIISTCLSLTNFDKNFDDGSECYTQTLIEELRQYNTNNYSKFNPSFQNLIEPYVSIEDNPLNKYLDSIKEKMQEITQN